MSLCLQPGCDRALMHSGSHMTLSRRPGPPPAAHAAGIAASDTAADYKWTGLERMIVDRAIGAVARRLRVFTTDDLWEELGESVPVTKGLAGRLTAAKNAGIIAPTGTVVFSQRKGSHGHGQRLSLWRSRVYDA